MSNKKRKIRHEFRKNRAPRPRDADLTRHVESDEAIDRLVREERIGNKGDLVRKRTVVGEEVASDSAGFEVLPEIDQSICLKGRVLTVFGLSSTVRSDNGQLYQCATRRLLKTMSTEQRHVVAAGDHVWFRPSGEAEGIIERIEPRDHILSRTSKNRQHIIVTNVDQLLIVGSAAEPYLKPNLIDRFLVSAEKGRIHPLIVINKVDLIDLAELMPRAGVYARMGYPVHFVSAKTGQGIAGLRRAMAGVATAVVGQSGVGKSSLLNAVDPALNLKVGEISAENQKGKHTTTTARLLPLTGGGYVVDTPGIRQLQLWDVISAEVAGFYRDLRPFINRCRYPNCTHTHEAHCAIKDAVADGFLDARRYESYCQMYDGLPVEEF